MYLDMINICRFFRTPYQFMHYIVYTTANILRPTHYIVWLLELGIICLDGSVVRAFARERYALGSIPCWALFLIKKSDKELAPWSVRG